MDKKIEEQDVAGLDIGSLPVTSDEEEKEIEEDGGKSAEGADETSEEENKVSYSRFKNIHERYRTEERRAQELEARVEELESNKAERIERETPSYEGKKWTTWVKLYGDTPQSRDAYQDFMSEFAPPDESYIREVASRAYRETERSDRVRIENNERTLDDQIEDVSVLIGRDLTDDEQVSLLEIMDKNSLTDDDGNILKLYPAEKAWDIYEIESRAGKESRTTARNKIAALNSSGTRGEPTPSRNQENKDFDPRWEALDSSMRRRQ